MLRELGRRADDTAGGEVLDNGREQRAEVGGCGAGADESCNHRYSASRLGVGDRAGHQRGFADSGSRMQHQWVVAGATKVARYFGKAGLAPNQDSALLL